MRYRHSDYKSNPVKPALLKPRKGEAEVPSANFRVRLYSDHPEAVEVAAKLYKMGVLPEQVEWI